MKKPIAALLFFCLVLSISGCDLTDHTPTTQAVISTTVPPSTAETIEPTVETTAPVVYSTPLSAISLPLVSEIDTQEDGTIIFTYTYQNVSTTFQDAEIADTVVLDLLNRIDATRSEAEDIRKAAAADYVPSNFWNPYFFQVLYTPVRIDQNVLSLYGTQTTYSGSAHPNHLAVSANYDLVTGAPLRFGDVLAADYSAETLSGLLAEALSPYGDVLYPGYEQTVQDFLSDDINNFENWYFSQGGLCIYFSPYDIAPYSAGTVIGEIPYEQLNGILRDEYFPMERSAVSGSITLVPFDTADRSQISQYAELVLQSDGTRLLLEPEGTVLDLRIDLCRDDSATYYNTVFAAESLSAGGAVMLQANLTETDAVLRLSYFDGTEVVQAFLEPDGTLRPAE